MFSRGKKSGKNEVSAANPFECFVNADPSHILPEQTALDISPKPPATTEWE